MQTEKTLSTQTLDKKTELRCCTECGTPLIGVPWKVRACSNCDTYFLPNYTHPDCPPELRANFENVITNIVEAIMRGEVKEGIAK